MIKFGASIDKVDNSIYINGMKDLHGSFVEGGDIRSVVSLINTALFIKDQTTIYGLEHLNRGHRNFINKLNQLGADIEIE
jgi:UDP-N-acetylglucosamine 1-carboxyvinyltransferase